MAVIYLDRIEHVTLYTGNNGSAYCTCKCPCCSQKGRNRHYQGTIKQAIKMFEKLTNMKQLYLFGNPDVTVDADFCHTVIEEAVRRNIHICFSTSGVGGKKVLEKLLKGIPTEMVDYISFSFDGTTKQEMSFAKGIDYPMERALEGLEWALKKGYTVKVQPTLWSYNYTKAEEIINFFSTKGVNWFTFHIGSLETEFGLPSHRHLTPEQIKEVHNQIDKAIGKSNHTIKAKCPIIYMECGENEPQKWYCMQPEKAKKLLVIFTEKGIRATHVPMASFFNENFGFYLENDNPNIPEIPENGICPFGKKLSGKDDTCCRYVSKYWNY